MREDDLVIVPRHCLEGGRENVRQEDRSRRRWAELSDTTRNSCNLLVLEFSRVARPQNAIAQFTCGPAHQGFFHQVAAKGLAVVADDVVLDAFCQSVPA